ncbi:glycosyltransferase [Rubripirellula amarantea]|nr:glycosyltransferase [Rubripirellula amarantea]
MSTAERQIETSDPQAMSRFASFVGALPGPRTGMTYSTEQIVSRLRSCCSLREHDLGTSFCDSRPLWRLKKMLVSFQATLVILSWKRRGNESIYMVVNSRAGLIYNLLHVAAARARGFRCILHHHVVNYIEVPDRRMRLLIHIAPRNTQHVMACQRMVDDFNLAYRSTVNALIVPPMVVDCVAPSDVPSDVPSRNELPDAAGQRRGFVVGYLSNLSIDKGLPEIIETFEMVAKNDDSVRLVLAGPCHGASDRRLLDQAIANHGGRIEYRGAVYDDDKVKFFQDIDGFLFPSKIDSWGIVLNESLAYGVPVISVDHACIPCLIAGAGLIVPPDVRFADRASEQIRQWMSDPVSHQIASEAAIRRGKQLESATKAAMQSLAFTIAGEDVPEPGHVDS